jgi:histidine triad (HIT) family protein
MATIFDRILDGEIPCYRLYEDDHVLAFLDVGPLSEGHALLIPKERVARVDQLSDEAAAAIGRALPRLCRAVVAATGVQDYNVLANTGAPAHQAVSHVHFHVIPKPSADAGLGIRWPAGKLDASAAERLQHRIREALEREG